MKNANKLIAFLLTVSMLLTFMPTVRAEEDGFSDGGEIPEYQPGPVLNDPIDYSDQPVSDDHAVVRCGSVMSSPMQRKLQQQIDSLLNYQPIDHQTVKDILLCALGGIPSFTDDLDPGHEFLW